MMGYQKMESLYLPPEYLRGIFSLTGIVMPPVLLHGRVVGRWKRKNRKLTVSLFEHIDPEGRRKMVQEAERLWGDGLRIELEEI